MKKYCTYALLILLTVPAIAQRKSVLHGIIKNAATAVSGRPSSSLSGDEIVAGLKEALSLGAQKSTDRLSSVNGFFKDAVIKILLPPEVRKVQTKLRLLGMGKLVDNAMLSMNRAAEDASKSAAPIFLDAIKKMTVQDALSILRGADTSATVYLRRTTSTNLTSAFLPIIEASLHKVDATKYWTQVFTAYNQFSLSPVNTDINSYVTGKALDGIFHYVAQEEKSIRANPGARATDLLKKVFGSK